MSFIPVAADRLPDVNGVADFVTNSSRAHVEVHGNVVAVFPRSPSTGRVIRSEWISVQLQGLAALAVIDAALQPRQVHEEVIDKFDTFTFHTPSGEWRFRKNMPSGGYVEYGITLFPPDSEDIAKYSLYVTNWGYEGDSFFAPTIC
jgi:hypothetical protein